MKKTITLLALAFTMGTATAQVVADFETFSLSANSSYSSSTSVPFQTANAYFPFYWDNANSYWSGGFSYTNKYDSITAGFGNLYGVRAYKGYTNSATYVIGQDGGQIKLKTQSTSSQPMNNLVEGFYVTNTTFAWKSMKKGDSFAKKFGGTSGNDPDYFGITVKGYYGGHLKTDTVNFYLADFRATNNAQDYIVDTWQFVDTHGLGIVDSIRFYMFSSDVGSFGINTPLFFAIDNFATTYIIPEGILKYSNSLNVTAAPNPFNGSLNILLNDNIENGKAVITDIAGKIVHSETLLQKETVINTDELQPGIYFLELSANDRKAVKKIIKN